MKIPLSKIDVDPKVKKAAISVLDSGHFILGREVEEFENDFAKFSNTKYAACVGSGTAASFSSPTEFGIKKGR